MELCPKGSCSNLNSPEQPAARRTPHRRQPGWPRCADPRHSGCASAPHAWHCSQQLRTAPTLSAAAAGSCPRQPRSRRGSQRFGCHPTPAAPTSGHDAWPLSGTPATNLHGVRAVVAPPGPFSAGHRDYYGGGRPRRMPHADPGFHRCQGPPALYTFLKKSILREAKED